MMAIILVLPVDVTKSLFHQGPKDLSFSMNLQICQNIFQSFLRAFEQFF
jgi:hypothetical protein